MFFGLELLELFFNGTAEVASDSKKKVVDNHVKKPRSMNDVPDSPSDGRTLFHRMACMRC